MKQTLIILLAFSFFWSCKYSKSENEQKVIASIYDEDFLYEDELARAIPAGFSAEDSANYAESYIDKWIRQKIMYKQAQYNLQENEEIQTKIENFKEKIYIHSYEQRLVSQKLSDEISDNDIYKYYEAHKEELALKDKIVKAYFVQISNEVSNKDKVLGWMKSNADYNIDKLKDYSYQFANKFFFGEEWIKLYSLKAELPYSAEMANASLTSTPVSFSDSLFTYYVKIIEEIPPGEIPPLPYVHNIIKDILLQKKRKAMIMNIRNELYEQAIRENKIKIYVK